MLERLQSAMKSVKESRPSSLFSHRFMTVRRGSPAARSGQIQQGDQLEAVEGRSVLNLPHREVAQILRRAGNTLRLTIVPRANNNASNLTEYTDKTESKLKKGLPPKQKDQRYYSVDLERGPTGFGFSLRGGSEYNMGLYVLGLMEGGPASRSQKIQVSDQLVEINGDSTGGMTHSQAVEQIRKGGHRIHLVLKKGNGYVPDYDHEGGAASPSSVCCEDTGAAGVVLSQPGSIKKPLKKRAEERIKPEAEEERRGAQEREQDSGNLASNAANSHSGRKRERERATQSATKTTLRTTEGEEEGLLEGEQRHGEEDRGRGKRRSSGGRRRSGKGGTPEGDGRRRREKDEQPDQRRKKENEETRERRKKEKQEDLNVLEARNEAEERAPFSFLMSFDEDGNLSEVESTHSFSEVSVTAASISFAESTWPYDLSDSREILPVPNLSPGPWLVPNPHKLSQVLDENRLSRSRGDLWF